MPTVMVSVDALFRLFSNVATRGQDVLNSKMRGPSHYAVLRWSK